MHMIWHRVNAVQMAVLIFAHSINVGIEISLVCLMYSRLGMLCAPYDMVSERNVTHSDCFSLNKVVASSHMLMVTV